MYGIWGVPLERKPTTAGVSVNERESQSKKQSNRFDENDRVWQCRHSMTSPWERDRLRKIILESTAVIRT